MRGLGQVAAERELVAHCPGEDEECAFVGGEGCYVRFEVVGGGIFSEDVVKEGSVLDCGEHVRCGCCYYVACHVKLFSILLKKKVDWEHTAEVKRSWSRP